jgi:hypothetical protein
VRQMTTLSQTYIALIDYATQISNEEKF